MPVPASAKIALACVLAGSILYAFYGPPPASAHRGGAISTAVLGAAGYVVALAVAVAHQPAVARYLIAAAVETLCLAAWLARGRDDRRWDPPEPEPDPPIDWALFDRERELWSRRPRRPTPV